MRGGIVKSALYRALRIAGLPRASAVAGGSGPCVSYDGLRTYGLLKAWQGDRMVRGVHTSLLCRRIPTPCCPLTFFGGVISHIRQVVKRSLRLAAPAFMVRALNEGLEVCNAKLPSPSHLRRRFRSTSPWRLSSASGTRTAAGFFVVGMQAAAPSQVTTGFGRNTSRFQRLTRIMCSFVWERCGTQPRTLWRTAWTPRSAHWTCRTSPRGKIGPTGLGSIWPGIHGDRPQHQGPQITDLCF